MLELFFSWHFQTKAINFSQKDNFCSLRLWVKARQWKCHRKIRGLVLSHFVRKKLLLLLLSIIILIIGFTCPPNIHFKFVTSLRQVLLQSAMAFYYKVSQLVYYNVRQVLLQSATILLQIATGITRCDRISSKGWTFFLNNNCNILVKKNVRIQSPKSVGKLI